MMTENVFQLLKALVVNVNPHNMITSWYLPFDQTFFPTGPNVKVKSGLGNETILVATGPQACSQKILLGSAFEEKVDLLIVQYSPGAVAIYNCMVYAYSPHS